MATKAQIKTFMAEILAETGEKLTMAQARALYEQQVGGPTSEFVEMAGQPELEAVAPKVATAGPTLHVKQGLALRGGRGEWYKLLCKYDGKPVADYVADGKANPASRYTARSTKCGQPKTPESRLSWFKRAGIVTIS
jgi:hypothetical protein